MSNKYNAIFKGFNVIYDISLMEKSESRVTVVLYNELLY